MVYVKQGSSNADANGLEQALKDLGIPDPTLAAVHRQVATGNEAGVEGTAGVVWLPRIQVKPSNIHELGVFLVESVCRGQVIMSDLPLLRMSVDEPLDEDELINQVETLNAVDRHCFHMLGRDKGCIKLASTQEKFEMELEVSSITAVHFVIAVFWARAIAPCQGHYEAGIEHCLYPTIGFVNHSCHPNAEATWNAETGRMTIRATVDIPKDVEVKITYINPYQEKQSRSAALGFRCRCRVCKLTGKEEQDSERQRKVIIDGIEQMKAYRGRYFQPDNEEVNLTEGIAEKMIANRDALVAVRKAAMGVSEAVERTGLRHSSLDVMYEIAFFVSWAYLLAGDRSEWTVDRAEKLAMNEMQHFEMLAIALGIRHPRCQVVRERLTGMSANDKKVMKKLVKWYGRFADDEGIREKKSG